MSLTDRCVFPGCVSTDRHFHGGFPGGRENPAHPDGAPIPFTSEPAPGVRDYNGALLTFDMRSSALLVFLRYIEEKRRLRPGQPEVDAAFFDALDMVRNYVRGLVEPERSAS
ncbi:MAG: hypothetical protein M3N43_14810 [Actinomycetota bacterium]|nr:hypothetical protein [Actinomycetota bacterium]